MKIRRYFPLGKAEGSTFCNRVDETKRLIQYMESGMHTYLVAPRRYGKSSLCDHALAKVKIPSVTIDFHLAVNQKQAEHIILRGVTQLIGKSIGSIHKFQHLIAQYIKKLKPTMTLGTEHMQLELTVSEDSNPAENIAESLLLLEKLLQERDQQAVLLLDEFQEIGGMHSGRGIEGAIRHVAQDTKNLSIIFSGSNPKMLTAMFEDERRPLYKLCRKLILDRIHEKDYQRYVNHVAKSTWEKELSQDVFEKIMLLTERHPYYVNYLCSELWLDDKIPTIPAINAAWDRVIEEEKSDLIKDFLSLPDNARKMLMYMAKHGGANLYSNEAAIKSDIPSGSIPATLNTLMEKNYIEKTEDVFRIIVPAYKKLLIA